MIEERHTYYLTTEDLKKFLGIDDSWRLERAHPSDKQEYEMKVEFVREVKGKEDG